MPGPGGQRGHRHPEEGTSGGHQSGQLRQVPLAWPGDGDRDGASVTASDRTLRPARSGGVPHPPPPHHRDPLPAAPAARGSRERTQGDPGDTGPGGTRRVGVRQLSGERAGAGEAAGTALGGPSRGGSVRTSPPGLRSGHRSPPNPPPQPPPPRVLLSNAAGGGSPRPAPAPAAAPARDKGQDRAPCSTPQLGAGETRRPQQGTQSKGRGGHRVGVTQAPGGDTDRGRPDPAGTGRG